MSCSAAACSFDAGVAGSATRAPGRCAASSAAITLSHCAVKTYTVTYQWTAVFLQSAFRSHRDSQRWRRAQGQLARPRAERPAVALPPGAASLLSKLHGF